MAYKNELLPAFNGKCIPIVFCCDDKYIKYLSVAIQSIIDNASKRDNYDILVLYTCISQHNLDLIKSQFKYLKNFSCRFVNVNESVSNLKLSGRNHITKETFYRILIIDLLNAYSKVIYLDCDLVVDENIEHLFKIDISKYYLAACRDIIGIGVSHAPYGFIRKHQYKVLRLNNYDNYFNAGVLLMNLSLLRKDFTSANMLKMCIENNYKWMDQDVLNVTCESKVLLLDNKWNMANHRRHCREAKHTPKEIYKRWKQSSSCPSIYHFEGSKMCKPWLYPFAYPSFFFWKYAYKTPFYKIIFDSMLNQTFFRIRKKRMTRKINEYIQNAKAAIIS